MEWLLLSSTLAMGTIGFSTGYYWHKYKTRIPDNSNEFLHNKGAVVFIRWKNTPYWPIETISSNITSLLGYTPQELLSHKITYASLIHPDDKSRVEQEVLHFCESGFKTIEHLPYRLKNKQGEFRWIYDFTMIIRNTHDKIIGFTGYIIDITSQKILEQQLHKIQERYELAIDGAEDGLWDWNIITGEVYYSKRYKTMLGYNFLEIPSHYEIKLSLLHPEDKPLFEQALHQAFSHQKENFSYEYRMRLNNGHYLWVLNRAKIVYNDNFTPIRMVGYHTNIHDRRQLQESLIKLNKTLEESVESEVSKRFVLENERHIHEKKFLKHSRLITAGSMISTLSHHWRQPLTIISLSTQDFLDAYTYNELSADYLHKNVLKIQNQIRYMTATLDNFKDFFRDHKEKISFELEKIVHDSLMIIKPLLINNGIALILDLNHCHETLLNGYPNEFKQAIINIILFLKEEMKVIHSNELHMGCSSTSLYFSFEGIEESMCQQVLETISMEDASNHDLFELYMTQNIISEHGGVLHFDDSSMQLLIRFVTL